MLEYAVEARRIDAHGSQATAKSATLVLDTDVNGRPDAFNPAELLLDDDARLVRQGLSPSLEEVAAAGEVKQWAARALVEAARKPAA